MLWELAATKDDLDPSINVFQNDNHIYFYLITLAEALYAIVRHLYRPALDIFTQPNTIVDVSQYQLQVSIYFPHMTIDGKAF